MHPLSLVALQVILFYRFHPIEILLAAKTLQPAILTWRRMLVGLDLEPITEDKLVSGVACSQHRLNYRKPHNAVTVTLRTCCSLLFSAVVK